MVLMYMTFFCFVLFFLYAMFLLFEERKKPVRRRVAAFLEEESTETERIAEDENTEKRGRMQWLRMLFSPLWREWKRSFKRKMPGEKEAKLETLLMQAGSPFGMGAVEYRLLQLSLIFLLPVLCGAYAVFLGMSLGGKLMLVLLGFTAAVGLPRLYLGMKIKSRNRLALRELPDVLDLLTVSLEAGLGFDSALSKLVAKKEGVLSTEFHRCLEEIRLGKTRREALQGVRERLTVDEIRLLISSILQAEKLGVGLVQVLRVQSQEVRQQRRQRAEEEAMKAPIKMLFPLVLFIFPSLFIVLLGPAVIDFIAVMRDVA